MDYDVAIIGAGPAGSTCAALCAQAGWRTLLIEKTRFPRDKVCGDCLNPECWPILDRLGAADSVRAEPHSRLTRVTFVSPRGRTLHLPLAASDRGEIAIPRRLFDAVLLSRAKALGADVHESTALTSLEKGWAIHTTQGVFSRPGGSWPPTAEIPPWRDCSVSCPPPARIGSACKPMCRCLPNSATAWPCIFCPSDTAA